jgi:hypothetical protein
MTSNTNVPKAARPTDVIWGVGILTVFGIIVTLASRI